MAPSSWPIRPLSALVEVVREAIAPSRLEKARAVMLYSIPAFDGLREPETIACTSLKSGKYRVPRDCVLLSRLNPHIPRIWRVQRSDETLAVSSTEFWPIVAKSEEIDLDFLACVLANKSFLDHPLIRPAATTRSHQRIELSALHRFTLPVPPRQVQAKIATVLESVAAATKTTQAVIDQLQVVKEAMLAELLARGIPGRHARFKIGETGEMPNDWDEVALSSLVAEGPTNGLYKPATMIGRGSLIAGMTAIDGSLLDWSKCRRAELTKEESRAFGLTTGDILVTRVYARVEGVGRFILVGSPPEVAVYESNMMRIRVRRDRISPEFLIAYMSFSDVRRALIQRTTLGAQASINRSGLNSLMIRLPSLAEQEDITASVNAIEGRTQEERRSWRLLLDLKSALLPALLTGEIRVTPDEAPA